MNMKAINPFLCFLLLAFAGARAGQLQFETQEVEVKADLLDNQTTALYRFTNTSDQTVAITHLKSSCGCTVPELEKREYAPGESGEIKAVFNFGNRHGVQRKRITVATDDETYQLLFTTHIPDWATIQPQILRWTMGDPPAPKEIRLSIASPDNVELVESALNPEHFEIMEVKTGEDEWIFSVVPKSTAVRATERITFKLRGTNGTAETIRQMPFHCLIR